MRIGVLSDTHGFLDPKLLDYFSVCDEIWHAGDIGSEEIVTQLKSTKPTRVVFGNIDDLKLQRTLPEDEWFTCENLTVLITHIAGSPPRYNPRLKKLLAQRKPDILVCGHSHILRVIRDKQMNFLYLNPGACGNQGFHIMRTALRFEIHQRKISNMEVIELGRRGALPTSQ